MLLADCLSAFMALNGITSLTKAHLELMSHLDGTRTTDGYQHLLRSVVAKAKELKQRIDEGEKFEPVPPGAKKSGANTPKTPRKRPAESSQAMESPSKKAKTAPKGKSMDDMEADEAEGQGVLSDGYHDLIKREDEDWEASFV